MSPVVVLFKLFFQELCKKKIGWDEILEGELRKKWERIVSGLQNVEPLILPRCYLFGNPNSISPYTAHGFCDSSKRAYAAVVYLCVNTTCGRYVKFLASKTRVAPVAQQSIPRLELLSPLILAVTTVVNVLQDEFDIADTVCWTDSKVALFWITVCEIRKLVPPKHWRHCHGTENPANIPSRGMTASELSQVREWREGPEWLSKSEEPRCVRHDSDDMPAECITEIKAID